MSKMLTIEEFVEKANIIHNNKYEYYNAIYSGRLNSIVINCIKHGSFKQVAYAHLKGQGCPMCAGESRRMGSNEFIKQAQMRHNHKYDYSNTMYNTARCKVTIICPRHGTFKQRPFDHLNGSGCPMCVGLNKMNNDEFIEKSQKIFGNKFGYENTKYENSHSKVIIHCEKHGKFKVTPNNHLSKKQGCPVSRESKGEEKIREFLDDLGIKYVREYSFEDCIGKKRKLPFDFYLPDSNLIIEFDGRHHFEIVDAFGGSQGFNETKKNDKIKNNFLMNNKINLLRIPYYRINNINKLIMSVV